MALQGHGDAKYRTGTRLSSSKDSSDYTQLLVERWSHDAGELTGLTPMETEIGILLKGNLTVERSGDGEYQKSHGVPGTIWLCPAGIHEDFVQLSGNMEECVHLYIPAMPFSDAALKEFDIDPDRVQLNYAGGFHDALIEQIIMTIVAEMENESMGSHLLIETLRSALAAHLVKNYSNLSSKQLVADTPSGALGPKKLERIEAYIAANIHQVITLDDLAEEACLSPCHFARAFKVAMGSTPHQYITRQKLAYAKKLLVDDNMSLTQVALGCGFSSQAHFTKAFKRAVGLTPGEYRKKIYC
jgi:AraC family transcriptional regulator